MFGYSICIQKLILEFQFAYTAMFLLDAFVSMTHVSIALCHLLQFTLSAELRTYGSGIQNKAVLVECNSPVTVMAANRETFSTDAFIVFPESSLGQLVSFSLNCFSRKSFKELK